MAGPFTEFGYRTGHVDLIDFDKAVVRGLGAQWDYNKNEWYLPLNLYLEIPEGIVTPDTGEPNPPPGPMTISRAKVVYKRPEPTQVEFDLPEIAIIRDDLVPDASRLQTTTQQYRLPAEGATPISVNGMLGWSQYENKDQERPYDITYTIECWARFRTVAIMLLQMMMARFPIRGKVTVIDSINNPRVYLAIQEGTSDLLEVSSLVDRVAGYSLTIRVEGELTLDRMPITETPFTGTQTPTPPVGPPATPENPNLPPGGLYGDGLPCVRVTVMENDKT